jgi:RhoGAP domain
MIKKKIEKGKPNLSLTEEKPHILAGLLVRFLEELHIALISEGPYDCVLMAMREDTRMERLACLRRTLEQVMPQWNLLVLIRVLGLLRDYLELAEKNKVGVVLEVCMSGRVSTDSCGQ